MVFEGSRYSDWSDRLTQSTFEMIDNLVNVVANDRNTAVGPVVFDHLFELWGVLDETGRVITISGSIFDNVKVDPQLLPGQMFSETAFWQTSEATSRAVTSAVADAGQGRVVEVNVDFRISSKERRPVELILVPTGDQGQIFVCARHTKISIEDQLKAGDPSAEFLFAAEIAGIGLWYWNFEDDRLRFSAPCAQILGSSDCEDLTYEGFIARVHPEDRSTVRRYLADTIRSGDRYSFSFRVEGPDGDVEWITAEGKSFLSEDGSPERMVGIIRTITHEKRAAEELESVYERERAARDEAEEANRSKDVFLAFVSHELRAPLNAILGWSNILLTKPTDEQTRRNAIETIERSARMQTKLINDLVDSARVASGKIRLEFRPTELFQVVRNAFEAQRPAAENRGLGYEITAERITAYVMGDANRLQQVFGNLLSNAIKFTPPGGNVYVDVVGTDGHVSVTIADSGEGISSETLPNIFKQFSQVGAGERKSVGLGLGLSIAKTLVEKHGGSVYAESDGVGKGSRFVVSLPIFDVSNIERNDREASADPHHRLSGLTILIVEDEDDSRDVLRIHLENHGAVVIPAESAAIAHERLINAETLPNLIISDIGMPHEDGLSFVKRVRGSADERISTIPAIALSAFATSEFKANALECGFQRYVAKPFDPEALTMAILEQLDRKE
jgi:PAS domain S-box-containing protein